MHYYPKLFQVYESAISQEIFERKLRHTTRNCALPGTPDVVLPDHKLAIFVHGCFWHRHRGCHRTTWPKTHHRFWEDKFAENTRRDRRVVRAIRKRGWRTAIVWEC